MGQVAFNDTEAKKRPLWYILIGSFKKIWGPILFTKQKGSALEF